MFVNSEGYFHDVRGVCVPDGAYMCLAPPTLYACTHCIVLCFELLLVMIWSQAALSGKELGKLQLVLIIRQTQRDKYINIKLCFNFFISHLGCCDVQPIVCHKHRKLQCIQVIKQINFLKTLF